VFRNIVKLAGYSVAHEHLIPSFVISQTCFQIAGGAQPIA
jgi:hypothetical protein